MCSSISCDHVYIMKADRIKETRGSTFSSGITFAVAFGNTSAKKVARITKLVQMKSFLLSVASATSTDEPLFGMAK
eukprot:Skav220266  [mRNA]  locus=scaffold3532:18777:20436:+ [translate_table: standard]